MWRLILEWEERWERRVSCNEDCCGKTHGLGDRQRFSWDRSMGTALQCKAHAYSPGSAAKFPFSSFVSPGVYEINTVISYVQMRTLRHQATLPRLECSLALEQGRNPSHPALKLRITATPSFLPKWEGMKECGEMTGVHLSLGEKLYLMVFVTLCRWKLGCLPKMREYDGRKIWRKLQTFTFS